MPHNVKGLLVVPRGATIQKRRNPATGWTDFHQRVYKNLFPTAPSVADVRQGTLGDCYLISALIAILNMPAGPTVIEECFEDRSEYGPSGEVIIRLYDATCAAQYL